MAGNGDQYKKSIHQKNKNHANLYSSLLKKDVHLKLCV